MSNKNRVVNKPQDIYNFLTEEGKEKGENRFDFSGVTFNCAMNFNKVLLENKFRNVDFSDAIFKEYVSFIKTEFAGQSIFKNAKFLGEVTFSNVPFLGTADFFKAQFSGKAGFFRAFFQGKTDFSRTKFSDANFKYTEFKNKVDFSHTQFSGEAGFFKADFFWEVSFLKSLFLGKANFFHALFSDVDFKNAQFLDKAYFSRAEFSRSSNFINTKFAGTANFSRVKFSRETNFSCAQFLDMANFSCAQFSDVANFSEILFYGITNFINVEFTNQSLTNFQFTQFHDITIFYNTKFLGRHNNFSAVVMSKTIFFDGIEMDKANRNTFRLIKHEFLKNNNRIDALIFHKKEMLAYWHDLFGEDSNESSLSKNFFTKIKGLLKSKRCGEKFILFLNRYSNDFGLSWGRGIIFTLISVSLPFFLIYLTTLSNSYFEWGWNGWKEYWSVFDISLNYWVQFLNPAHSFHFMEDYNPNPIGLAYLIDGLSRIFITFGYYQTIQAFRKYKFL